MAQNGHVSFVMGYHFWKIFWKNAFLTLFSPIFGPKIAHFRGILGFLKGQNRATTSSKRAKNTCFGIPRGLGSFLKNKSFLPHPVALLMHFGTHLFGILLVACPRLSLTQKKKKSRPERGNFKRPRGQYMSSPRCSQLLNHESLAPNWSQHTTI